MKKIWIGLIVIFTIACSCLPSGLLNLDEEPSNQNSTRTSPFSEIIFCEDVSDDGDLYNCGVNFPEGTKLIWAYFEYEGLNNGELWGRVWYKDQELYIDSRGEDWVDGFSGWVAYSMEADEPQLPLSGNYRLELYLGDSMVEAGDFYVKPTELLSPETGPGIGTIQFAHNISDDYSPIGAASQFEYGVTEVYAVFPFVEMEYGTIFKREWVQDGLVVAESEYLWEEGYQGIDYALIFDDDYLSPGYYTLNLYIEGQIARTANFEILGEPEPEQQPPASPEEIIDEYMMPAWENLANSHQEILRDLAQFALDHHVKISVDPNYDGEASYRYSCSEPPIAGEIVVSQNYWDNNSWEMVTSTLGHELTHAVQHMSGNYRCGCSIEKEYYAFITSFYVLQEMDRMDLLEDKYRGVAYDDDSGRFDGNMLWDVLKKVYSECPEY